MRTVVFVLALLIPVQIVRADTNVEIRSGTFTIEVAARGQANLIYQLDCLSGAITCSKEVFEALWRGQLGFRSDDQKLLEEWTSLRKGVADVDSSKDPTLAVKADYPLRIDNDDRAWNRLRWADSLADDREALKRAWLELMPAPTANRLLEILDAFRMRFDVWWKENKSAAIRFVPAVSGAMQKAHAGELLSAAAKLYRSDLGDRRVFLDLMLQPNTRTGHTRATRIGAHMVVEILPDEQAEDRVDVIVHELAHHVFGRMPPKQQARLVDALLATGSAGVPSWELFNEVQATVIGNYLAERNVRSPEQFQRKLQRPLSLYNEELIDLGARATAHVLETALEKGAMRGSFAADFVAALQAALGAKLDTPSLHLRSVVMSAAEWRSPWLEKIRNTIAASKPRLSISAWRLAPLASAEFMERLQRFRGLSAVVVAFADQVPQLAPASSLLGVTPEALLVALGEGRGVVFVARRSPQAYAFVFVARDEAAMDGLIAAFPSCRLKPGVCVRIE